MRSPSDAPSFRVPWKALLTGAFREGEFQLAIRKLRKRVLAAAQAAYEEAGVQPPDRHAAARNLHWPCA